MFNKSIDYDALWDEIESELDTDVSIDDYQGVNAIYPSSHQGCFHRPIYDPLFFIFFPHRRRFF
jgi:hypothetical protein